MIVLRLIRTAPIAGFRINTKTCCNQLAKERQNIVPAAHHRVLIIFYK